MAVNLSIKNVPDDIAEHLRRRAERHHRSLQGELMAILECSVREEESYTPIQVWEAVRQLGLRTPAESKKMIREDRDGRTRH
jgi:plasmid stability protein